MFGVTGLRFSSTRIDASGNVMPAMDYLVWSLFWILGHLLGGIAVGAVAGWLGSYLPALPRIIALAAVSLLCTLWAFAEIGLVRIPMPQWRRQVQRHWLGRLPWNLVALGYGVQLGSAVATRIKTTTTYAALCCALLVGSATAGVVVLMAFAVARALPALVVGPLVASPESSRRFAVKLSTYAETVAKMNAAILLAAAILLLWTAWLAATRIVFQ
jgi:hypothetical protein